MLHAYVIYCDIKPIMHINTVLLVTVTIVLGPLYTPIYCSQADIDTDIDSYVESLLLKFCKSMIYPDPDFNLPKLDPLDLSNISFDITQYDSRLTGTIPNITIWKMSQFSLEYIHVNMEETFANFTVLFPTILTNLTSILEGNIGNISIEKSNISGWFQLTSVHVTDGVIQLGFENNTYYVKNIDFDFTFHNETSGYLYGLKSEDKTEKELNSLLHSAIADIIKGYKEHIIEFVSKSAISLENNIFRGRTISDVIDIINSWNYP